MRSGGAAAALLPLPADLALTAAARLGSEMLGTAVLLVGAHLRRVRSAGALPSQPQCGVSCPPCGCAHAPRAVCVALASASGPATLNKALMCTRKAARTGCGTACTRRAARHALFLSNL